MGPCSLGRGHHDGSVLPIGLDLLPSSGASKDEDLLQADKASVWSLLRIAETLIL